MSMLARDTAPRPHRAQPATCLAPARATRDAIGDGRRAVMVRRLFCVADQSAGVVLDAMRRVCEGEGLRVVVLDAPADIDVQATPRSVLAWIGGGGHDTTVWSRLLALAARDDIDLVAVAGNAGGTALWPCIAHADDGPKVARVAEAHAVFGSVASGAPDRDSPPDADQACFRRVERLLADGRRGQARQFLAAQIARAERRERHDDALPLRLALARLSHDDLDPADVRRVLMPALRRGSLVTSAASGTGSRGALVHDRLAATIMACHASIDLLLLQQAQQLAGGASVTADATGDHVFEAAHAQWRVCWWLGDVDGALSQVARLEASARSAMHQVITRRAAIRTCVTRWPDEASAHRLWLRQHADTPDRDRAGLVRRALAEDALMTGDLPQARAWLDAAKRTYGRRLSTRTRAGMAMLALAIGGDRDERDVAGRRVPAATEGATPLLALCAEIVRARVLGGASPPRRAASRERGACVRERCAVAQTHRGPRHDRRLAAGD